MLNVCSQRSSPVFTNVTPYPVMEQRTMKLFDTKMILCAHTKHQLCTDHQKSVLRFQWFRHGGHSRIRRTVSNRCSTFDCFGREESSQFQRKAICTGVDLQMEIFHKYLKGRKGYNRLFAFNQLHSRIEYSCLRYVGVLDTLKVIFLLDKRKGISNGMDREGRENLNAM